MMAVIAGLMDNTLTKRAYHLITYLTLGNILSSYTLNGARRSTIMKFMFLFIVMNKFKILREFNLTASKECYNKHVLIWLKKVEN